MKYHIKNYALLAILTATLIVSACKKDKDKGPDDSGDRRDLTNDSLFLYAKQIYYWNSSLPSYEAFQPRKYTNSSTDLGNYENNLLNIGKAANSPDYIPGNTFLKYSYIEDITERNPAAISAKPNPQAAVDLEGNGNDIGIRPVFYFLDNAQITYALFITAVYKGSDAEKKGSEAGLADRKDQWNSSWGQLRCRKEHGQFCIKLR